MRIVVADMFGVFLNKIMVFIFCSFVSCRCMCALWQMYSAFMKCLRPLFRYEAMVRAEPSLALIDPKAPTTPTEQRVVAAASTLLAAQRTLIHEIYASRPMRSVKPSLGALYTRIERRRTYAAIAVECDAPIVITPDAGAATSAECELSAVSCSCVRITFGSSASASVHPAWANLLHLINFAFHIPAHIRNAVGVAVSATVSRVRVEFTARVAQCIELICQMLGINPFVPLLLSVRATHSALTNPDLVVCAVRV